MACQVNDITISSGLGRILGKGKEKVIADKTWPFLTLKCKDVCVTSQIRSKALGNQNGVRDWCLSASSQRNDLFISPVVLRRNAHFGVARNQLSSDCEVDFSDVEESLYAEIDDASSWDGNGAAQWKELPHYQQQPLDVKRELLSLCAPAIVGQAIEPFAQLMETAYIGRLGALELASAGVSINIFNYISKVFNIPLLSVATSFVAEDISKHASSDSSEGYADGKLAARLSERKQLSSVSTALLLAVGIGLFEAIALYFGSGVFLNIMGITSESSLHIPAQRFLSLRALGAPAVVLYLTLQGVFRGFKDTRTPVLCLGIGNLLAVCLFPMLIYYFQLGATGAAISTVVSQYVIAFLMLWFLNKKAVLLPPKFGALQFDVYMKSGGFLLGRTLSVLTTMTLGTSMAARQGAVAMAAHQICMQVWLAVSLLTDALGASSQAMIASSVSKGDYKTAKEVTGLSLKMALLTGTILFAILGVSFGSLATVFTKDADVLAIVRTGALFVSASQPLNSLAFVFDGLHYGVSDFPYAACSMMVVGVISSSILLYASSVWGLRGLWLGLSIFMGLRTAAGFFRLVSKNSPWWFLHSNFQNTKELATFWLCLFPLLIYYFQMGATGAAISTVVSQYAAAFSMIWFLSKRVVLLSPKFGALQFGGYMKSGSFLLGRTLSVLTTTTVATSTVARQGAVHMAAHQICMQVWLAVSILTDALATSSQVMVASAVSKGDYKTAKKVTGLALKVGFLVGIILFAIIGESFCSLAPLFTKDPRVLEIVRTELLIAFKKWSMVVPAQ